MIVVEQAVDPRRARRHGTLLGRLAQGGSGRGLVAVPGPARRPPGPGVLGPVRAQDEQHAGLPVRPGAQASRPAAPCLPQ